MEPILPRVPTPRLWMMWLVVVAAICLAWVVLGNQSGGWAELARLWGVLAAGTLLGLAAARGRRDGESKSVTAGQMTYEDLFFDALNRELCRARRDGGSFAVLSVDWKMGRHDISSRRVCELLDAELRAYADLAQVGERVLALVPAVGDSQYEPLLNRLTASLEAADCGQVRIGLGRFPQDAVCAKDLIDIADRKRLVRGVVHVTSDSHGQALSQMLS